MTRHNLTRLDKRLVKKAKCNIFWHAFFVINTMIQYCFTVWIEIMGMILEIEKGSNILLLIIASLISFAININVSLKVVRGNGKFTQDSINNFYEIVYKTLAVVAQFSSFIITSFIQAIGWGESWIMRTGVVCKEFGAVTPTIHQSMKQYQEKDKRESWLAGFSQYSHIKYPMIKRLVSCFCN